MISDCHIETVEGKNLALDFLFLDCQKTFRGEILRHPDRVPQDDKLMNFFLGKRRTGWSMISLSCHSERSVSGVKNLAFALCYRGFFNGVASKGFSNMSNKDLTTFQDLTTFLLVLIP